MRKIFCAQRLCCRFAKYCNDLLFNILNYSVSLSYIFSDTGIWHKDAPDYTDHTVVASFRYKYSENVDGWMSIGMTTETPFVAAGMRIAF